MEYDLEYDENCKILVLNDEMVADYFWDAYFNSYSNMHEYFEDKLEKNYTVLDYFDAYYYDMNELLCRAYSNEIEYLEERPFNYESFDKVGEVAIDEGLVLDPATLMKGKESEYLKDFLSDDIKQYDQEDISKFLLAIATSHPEIIPEIEKAIIETNLELNDSEAKPNKRRL
ncbi:hypothetical protein [Leclercia adecarboxylata]|uniref:hypothetical protein n=1 Tax=Leclercia adecarboxylata TaxID=83655 RepID=UPI00301B689B